MKNSACFCGHRDISIYDELLKSKIYNTVLDLYENHNIVNFLSGGMGNFDTMCENEILQLKKIYPKIKLFLIIPYYSSKLNKNQEMFTQRYDEIIYPSFDKQYHYKQIIIERNKWLVENSDYIIVKIRHNHSGVFKTLQYAQKMNKNIILI